MTPPPSFFSPTPESGSAETDVGQGSPPANALEADLGLEAPVVGLLQTFWSEGLPQEARACLDTLPVAGPVTGLVAGPGGTLSGFLTPVTSPRLPVEPEGVAAERGDAASDAGGHGIRVALTVVPQGEAPAGPRVESLLRDALQRLARDESTDTVARVQALAGALLPPWREGLEHLGNLRWGLLTRTALTLDHAARTGASAALYLTHEIVSLQRTRESRRRNNREDLDRFLRRLSGGALPRLQRGVVAGPILVAPWGPAAAPISLYFAKTRRDLP